MRTPRTILLRLNKSLSHRLTSFLVLSLAQTRKSETIAWGMKTCLLGIIISVLQSRLFSYPDTHRHRLGVNYQQLPVNAPICPVANFRTLPKRFLSPTQQDRSLPVWLVFFLSGLSGEFLEFEQSVMVSWHSITKARAPTTSRLSYLSTILSPFIRHGTTRCSWVLLLLSCRKLRSVRSLPFCLFDFSVERCCCWCSRF